jgi:hypothetical protein
VSEKNEKCITAYGEYEKIPASFLRLREELGEKGLASPNVRMLADASLSQYGLPPQEIQIGAASVPMKYRRTSLREQIMKSNDPSLQPYKRLIEIMNLGDSRIKDLVVKTSRETGEKILFLHEKTGRVFEEFLFTDLDSSQIQLLDRIVRYWHLLEDSGVATCLEKRKEIDPLSYHVEIDGEKFDAKLWAFLDTDPLRLDLYMGRFGGYGEPVIGTLYRYWPCFDIFKTKLEEDYKSLQTSSLNDAIKRISNIKERYDLLREYENELIKFDIANWIAIPPQYTKKNGLFGGFLYVNKAQRPFPCPFCGKTHVYHFVAEVKKR